MTQNTDSDRIDVKKVRHVPSGGTVDNISIEDALQKIFKTAYEVETYICVALEAARAPDESVSYDRYDAIELMMQHAREAINTTWGLTEDLAKALGVNVHAKQENEVSA